MTNHTRSAGVLFSNADPSSSSSPIQPDTLAALASMLAAHQATHGPVLLSAVPPPPAAPAPAGVLSGPSSAPPAARPAPARAAARQNLRHVIIKQQVQVTLDLQRPSFTMWRRLFTVTLGQFGVLDHVDGDTDPRHEDPEWVQDDYTIVSWLYSTVSEEILSLIITPDDTAFAVWRRIENLFLDNAVTRAVYLDDEFHGQRQGNMTVSAYCSRLKSLADRLRDLGRTVTDADLVHRVLAGLRSDFRHAVTTLSREVPLPSFQDVRSFLVLQESRNHDGDGDPPTGTALHAAAPAFIKTLGFVCAKSDSSLFVLHQPIGTAYLLLYVDDVVLTASSTALLRRVIDRLQHEFSIKDMGFFLSQHKYAEELLERANMVDCKSATTPIDTSPKLSADAGSPVADASDYRSIVGALQYLTMTRPDICYAVQQACLHMHAPMDCHLAIVKRILRYVRGTAGYGLHLHRSSSLDLVAYSDADWAGCPDTRRSTSGYTVFLGNSLISWSSKRQPTVSRSSAEAEYRGVANVVAECCWLQQLLGELHVIIPKATVVYCDNISAVYLAANPVHHRRTKHIELDIHFVREKVALGHLRVLHVPTSQQYADVMTKGLPTSTFQDPSLQDSVSLEIGLSIHFHWTRSRSCTIY
uniref:Uncharacterized protein n=1 Tax=Avena sativa TaxID=4498 RepID=A0ACD5ZU54_AVESA